MGLFSGKSYIEKEKERVKKLLVEPMLELVLEHLPHLQLTPKEQEDAWEIIAIKLNSYQFDHTLENSEGEMIDLPTLNGPFVKEMFEDVFSAFELEIIGINRRRGIYRVGEVNGRLQHDQYFTYSFPVKEAYYRKRDIICSELFYMKSLDIEIKANLARERFTKKVELAPPQQLPEHELNEKFEHFVVLEEVKQEREKQDQWKVQRLLEELDKKNKRIEQLDKENKRLMELNKSLLER